MNQFERNRVIEYIHQLDLLWNKTMDHAAEIYTLKSAMESFFVGVRKRSCIPITDPQTHPEGVIKKTPQTPDKSLVLKRRKIDKATGCVQEHEHNVEYVDVKQLADAIKDSPTGHLYGKTTVVRKEIPSTGRPKKRK